MTLAPRSGRAHGPRWRWRAALMCLSFPVFPNDLQAWGNNLAAAAVIAGGLVWHILHPPSDAGGLVSNGRRATTSIQQQPR